MRGGRLWFTAETQQRRTEDDEFMRNRGGILYWNGSDTRAYAMHKPGENVQFTKQYITALRHRL